MTGQKISVCNLCVFMCVCFGGEGRKWGFAVPDWLASVALAALRSACRAICDWVPAKAPRLPVAARQHSVTRYVRINKTRTQTHAQTGKPVVDWCHSPRRASLRWMKPNQSTGGEGGEGLADGRLKHSVADASWLQDFGGCQFAFALRVLLSNEPKPFWVMNSAPRLWWRCIGDYRRWSTFV